MPESKVRQLAEAEAERAEAENPDESEEAAAEEETATPPAEPAEPPAPEPADETPPPPPEPPEPAEPPAPSAEAIAQAERIEQLEKAQTAYFKKVEKIVGTEQMWPECETCGGTGFDMTGGAGEPDFQPASNAETCPECAGFGGVLSGSKIPDQRVIRCGRCKGVGYLVERPVAIDDPSKVAPVVAEIAEGGGNGDQALALAPGDPGWEPWMGGSPVGAAGPPS